MLVSLLAEYGDLRVKIKEITEGIMDVIRNRVAAGPGSDFTKWSNYGGIAPEADPETDDTDADTSTDTTTDTPQPDDTSTDTTTDTPQPDDTSTDTSTDNEQPNTQQFDPQPDQVDTEMEKANANIKSKVDYLVKQGVLQSGRITDTEKQYIDSVDVYVDPNKFAKADPGQVLIKAKPPHVSNYSTSVQIPLSDWQEALGRDGTGLSGYVGFNLTPAGWWSDDYKAYVNPNGRLDDLITSYQK